MATNYIWELEYIEDVVSSLMNPEIEAVLIHGPGGTGKTALTQDIIRYMICNTQKTIRVTASTGVAAINLLPKIDDDSGDNLYATTLHSWAGVGLCQDPIDELIQEIKGHSKKLNKWLYTDVLVIDEISMVGCSFFTILDHIGKELRNKTLEFDEILGIYKETSRRWDSTKLFGGIKLLVIGDFLQLPPVKDDWVFHSDAWKNANMVVYNLTEPKRYDDIDYFERLQRFRKAEATKDDLKFLKSKVLNSKRIKELLEDDPKQPFKVKPTVIHSTRADVEYKNVEELNKLPGQTYTFKAIDDFSKLKRKTRYTKEQHTKLLEEKFPAQVELKVGAQIMLRVNLDLECGLVNGSRGVVRAIKRCTNMLMNNLSPIKTLAKDADTGDSVVEVLWKNGLITLVNNYTWTVRNEDGRSLRSQIPLTLAWAITSHKSQGCTLDYAICDLGSTIFAPGQFYVMLSRIKNEEGLYISFLDIDKIMADRDALDFVNELEREVSEEES